MRKWIGVTIDASNLKTSDGASITGDIVRIIGYVTSTANDKMYFYPDTTWVEL